MASCPYCGPFDAGSGFEDVSAASDASIRKQLAATQKVVDELNDRIDFLEARLYQLRRERQVHASNVSKYHNMLAPVCRFPSEILCQIFLQVNPHPRSIHELVSHSDLWDLTLCMDWIRTYSHVCRHWRNVSLSFPQLWSCISLQLRRHNMTRYSGIGLSNLARMHLERSRLHPLLVRLSLDMDTRSIPYLSVLDDFIAHSDRWRHASFFLGEEDVPRLSEVEGKLAMLEKLSFYSRARWGSLEGIDEPVRLFSTAPRLTDVSLHFLPLYQLEWSQITRLSISYRGLAIGFEDEEGEAKQIIVNHLLHGLQQAVSLQELDLGRQWKDATPRSRDKPLHLPLVRKASCPASWLPALTMPSLETMIIEADSAEVKPIMSDFLSRSQCSLQTLYLNGSRFSDILPLVPTIKSLDFRWPFTKVHHLITCLTIHGEEQPLCPDLDTVKLISSRPGPDDTDSKIIHPLVQMVKSRAHTLRKVWLYNCPDELATDVEEKLKLVSPQVQLRCYSGNVPPEFDD